MQAVLVADKYGRYLDGSVEALELFGVTLDELRALEIGAFSGPHAELAVTVWRRLASTGAAMPTGESTVHRPDGSQVRVRYLRIEPRADGAYELEMVIVGPGNEDAPPAADHPSTVLEAWRAAERDATATDGDRDEAARSAEGLRDLYRHSVDEMSKRPSKT